VADPSPEEEIPAARLAESGGGRMTVCPGLFITRLLSKDDLHERPTKLSLSMAGKSPRTLIYLHVYDCINLDRDTDRNNRGTRMI